MAESCCLQPFCFASCPTPRPARGLSIDAAAAAVRFRFRFRFCFARGWEKGIQGAGQGRASGRELTYKSSNGHSLWFGLLATPPSPFPLWSPHMCQYLCEMRLQSHRHKTLSIILCGMCVCVCLGGWEKAMSRGAWSVHGLGFSSLSMYELLLLLPLRFSFWEFVQRLHCLCPCPSVRPSVRAVKDKLLVV